MKTSIFVLFSLSIFCSSAIAQEELKIDRIKRDKEYLYVERQWIEDSPCITVVFRCKEDVESEKIS